MKKMQKITHNSPEREAIRELISQIKTAYNYHYKASLKCINNTTRWLEHDNAKAQCENLLDQIEKILSKHNVSLEEKGVGE